jgi:hypothetical protein
MAANGVPDTTSVIYIRSNYMQGMQGTFGKYKLIMDSPPKDVLPSPAYGMSCASEPVHYCFYEEADDTWLAMTFRNLSLTARIVDLNGNAVCGLTNGAKSDLGGNATSDFAIHILSTGTIPKQFDYAK